MRPDTTTSQPEVCGSAVLITAQNINKLSLINGGLKFKGKKRFLKKDYYFFLPDNSLAFTDTLEAKEFFASYKFVGYPDSHCLQAVTAIQL